jgi:benzoyl-CoA reductase/2-hydroxyglutaryl-CoA dehydratase subunit BcrC/BadD/HgdB
MLEQFVGFRVKLDVVVVSENHYRLKMAADLQYNGQVIYFLLIGKPWSRGMPSLSRHHQAENLVRN